MTKKSSSIGSYIGYGWKRVSARTHVLPVLAAFVVAVVLNLSIEYIGSSPTGAVDQLGQPIRSLTLLGGGLSLISLVFSFIVSIGYAKLGLHAVEGKQFSFAAMFVHRGKEFWKIIGATIIAGLVLLIPFGFLLGGGISYLYVSDAIFVNNPVGIGLAIVGFIVLLALIYASVRLSFFLTMTVIDNVDNLGIWSLVHRSWILGKGKFWKIIGVSILLGIVNFVGVLCLGIGLLWTIPLSQIAIAKFYRDVADQGQKNASTKDDEMLIA